MYIVYYCIQDYESVYREEVEHFRYLTEARNYVDEEEKYMNNFLNWYEIEKE